MIKVGLTGGLASGKTTISFFLKKKGFPVHESDKIVKKIYSKPKTNLLKHLKKIGLSNSIKNKKINKKTIREEIFNNTTKKRKLEKFIHNEVKNDRLRFLNYQKKKNAKVVILDIPLLFEAKLSKTCDYIIFLYLPKKIKINRASQRRGITKTIATKIINNQLKDSFKKQKSDYVINTSKNKKHSFKMILNIINNIIKKNA